MGYCWLTALRCWRSWFCLHNKHLLRGQGDLKGFEAKSSREEDWCEYQIHLADRRSQVSWQEMSLRLDWLPDGGFQIKERSVTTQHLWSLWANHKNYRFGTIKVWKNAQYKVPWHPKAHHCILGLDDLTVGLQKNGSAKQDGGTQKLGADVCHIPV